MVSVRESECMVHNQLLAQRAWRTNPYRLMRGFGDVQLHTSFPPQHPAVQMTRHRRQTTWRRQAQATAVLCAVCCCCCCCCYRADDKVWCAPPCRRLPFLTPPTLYECTMTLFSPPTSSRYCRLRCVLLLVVCSGSAAQQHVDPGGARPPVRLDAALAGGRRGWRDLRGTAEKSSSPRSTTPRRCLLRSRSAEGDGPGRVPAGVADDADHQRLDVYGRAEPVGVKVHEVLNTAPKSPH